MERHEMSREKDEGVDTNHIIEKEKIPFFNKRAFRVNLLAFLIGIIGALAAYGFKELWQNIGKLSTKFNNLIENSGAPSQLSIFILLIVAALITGPVISKWAPEAKGHGVPEVIEAVEMNQGIIRLRVPFVKAGVSGISIGAGMSLGSEGPIVQIAGGMASYIAQKFRLRASDTKLLVVCGVSAGISAIFNAPLGGVLFGLEAILVSVSITSILPILFSSLTSTILGQVLMGSNPIFYLPTLNLDELLPFNVIRSELWIFIILGIVSGLAGVLYQAVLYLVEQRIFDKMKISLTIKLIIGAIFVGIIAIWFPEVLSVGYEYIRKILSYDNFENFSVEDSPFKIISFGGDPFKIIILGSFVLFLLKLLATSLSIGSGASGGIFAPGLYLGTTIGAVVGGCLHAVLPIRTPIGLCALFGMAGVFGGAARIPFTMIIMTAELTGDYFVFLPLMITVFISYWINESINKYSIYTKKLAHKGIILHREELEEYLENFPILDIMPKNIVVLSEDMKVSEAIQMTQIYRFHGYPIIDEGGFLKGLITIDDLYKAQIQEKTEEKILKHAHCPENLFCTPFESVKTALDRMFINGIGRLPVVRSEKEKVVVGIITESDIINVIESQNLQLLRERMKRLKKDELEEKGLESFFYKKHTITKRKVKHLHSIVVSTEKKDKVDKTLKNDQIKITTKINNKIRYFSAKLWKKIRDYGTKLRNKKQKEKLKEK